MAVLYVLGSFDRKPRSFSDNSHFQCFPWLENWSTLFQVFQDGWEPWIITIIYYGTFYTTTTTVQNLEYIEYTVCDQDKCLNRAGLMCSSQANLWLSSQLQQYVQHRTNWEANQWTEATSLALNKLLYKLLGLEHTTACPCNSGLS